MWSCDLDPSLFFWSFRFSWFRRCFSSSSSCDKSQAGRCQLTRLTSSRCVRVHSCHRPIGEQHPFRAGHVTVLQVWLHSYFSGSLLPWRFTSVFSSRHLTADQTSHRANTPRSSVFSGQSARSFVYKTQIFLFRLSVIWTLLWNFSSSCSCNLVFTLKLFLFLFL